MRKLSCSQCKAIDCQPLPQRQLKEINIDTGADVTVPMIRSYDQIRDGPLLTSTRVLRNPAQKALRVCGVFKGKLRKADTEAEEEIYALQDLHKAPLSRPEIEFLHVVVQVAPIIMHKSAVVAQYPHLFTGLWCLQGACHTVY